MLHHRRRLGRLDNRLWIARKRARLPQKLVASLLGHRSLSTVSQYESGKNLPGLQTGLKLELIYQTPLAKLFPGLYDRLIREIAFVKERLPRLKLGESERRGVRAERGVTNDLAQD